MRKFWKIIGVAVALLFGSGIAVSSVQFAHAQGGSCQASVSYSAGTTTISVTVSNAASEGWHVVNVTKPDGSSEQWFGEPAFANGTFGEPTQRYQDVGTYSFSINLAGGGGCSASLTINADGTGTGSGGNSGSTYHPTCMIDPAVPMVWSQDGGKFYTEFKLMGPTKDLFRIEFGDGQGFQPYAADNIVRAPHDYNGEVDAIYNGQILVAATGELCKSFTVVVSGGQFSLLVEGELVSGNAEASANESVAVDQAAVSVDATVAQPGDPACVEEARVLYAKQVDAGPFVVNPNALCVGAFNASDGTLWFIDAGDAYPQEVYQYGFDTGTPVNVTWMAWADNHVLYTLSSDGTVGAIVDRIVGGNFRTFEIKASSAQITHGENGNPLRIVNAATNAPCVVTYKGYIDCDDGSVEVFTDEARTEIVAITPLGELVNGWTLYQGENGWYWSTHPELYGQGRHLGICPQATEVRFNQDASKVQYLVDGQQYDTDATGKRYAQGCKPLTE